MITDIVIGLQHGDEGKGKVTHHLLKKGEYTHCIRFNGSCNAGHTIYHEGKRFVTHHIPAGVFFGVKSIVGPGCVLNIDKFFEELQYLKSEGIDTENLVKVASNTHIIRQSHIDEDSREYKIGTTKSGNGPAYRDKYGRHGLRAESVEALSPFIIDIIEELYSHDDPVILMEGAQGFSLDIDWGDYPFVTSSHTGTAGAILNGIDPRSIRDVWGVAKVYETYVGNRVFQPDSPLFNDIQRVGKEVGATTGRPRQCNWLDCGQLQTAIKINGVNNLVINKMDILREIGVWGVRNPYLVLGSEEEMMKMIHSCCPPSVTSIFYSDSPEFI